MAGNTQGAPPVSGPRAPSSAAHPAPAGPAAIYPGGNSASTCCSTARCRSPASTVAGDHIQAEVETQQHPCHRHRIDVGGNLASPLTALDGSAKAALHVHQRRLHQPRNLPALDASANSEQQVQRARRPLFPARAGHHEDPHQRGPRRAAAVQLTQPGRERRLGAERAVDGTPAQLQVLGARTSIVVRW